MNAVHCPVLAYISHSNFTSRLRKTTLELIRIPERIIQTRRFVKTVEQVKMNDHAKRQSRFRRITPVNTIWSLVLSYKWRIWKLVYRLQMCVSAGSIKVSTYSPQELVVRLTWIFVKFVKLMNKPACYSLSLVYRRYHWTCTCMADIVIHFLQPYCSTPSSTS